MSMIARTQWPTPDDIAAAQQEAGIFTDYVNKTASTPMYTNEI